MTRLVDDLLEVGRVTGGKVQLQREPLDLAVTVMQLLDTWRNDSRFLHHEISTGCSRYGSSQTGHASNKYSQICSITLSSTPSGGEIRISLRAEGASAILEISDTGLGMPPELIGRVFDLFVQGERSLARELGGLGIGLTMVKRLVELHGGTVQATSDGPNHGATFTVELPAIERPAALTVVKTRATTTAMPRRVLIIEDDDDAADTLAELLRSDHQVSIARNGAEGIALACSLAPGVCAGRHRLTGHRWL